MDSKIGIAKLAATGIISTPLAREFERKCAEYGHDPATVLRDFMLGVSIGQIKLPERIERYDIRWD